MVRIKQLSLMAIIVTLSLTTSLRGADPPKKRTPDGDRPKTITREFLVSGRALNANHIRDRWDNYLFVRFDAKTKEPVELIVANFRPSEIKVDNGMTRLTFLPGGKGNLNVGGNRGLLVLTQKPDGSCRQQMHELPALSGNPIDEFRKARQTNPKLLLGAYLKQMFMLKPNHDTGDGKKVDLKTVKLKGNGRQQMLHAIYADQPEVIAKLLKQGAEVDARDQFKITLLKEAVDQRHIAAIRLLLEHKADPNAKDNWSYTPLLSAVWSESTEIIKLLVKHQADINGKNTAGTSLLRRAVDQKSIAMTKLLLELKADPNIKDRHHQDPLFSAIRSGSVEIIELLIKHGADINGKPRTEYAEYAPLAYAVMYHQDAAVRILIKAGANINKKDRYGVSILHKAARRGMPRVIEALIEAGADLEARDKWEKTPLDYAMYRKEWDEHRAEIISMLKKGRTKPAQEAKKTRRARE